jgi:hypothetical protein
MTRGILGLALLLAASDAHAFGVGSTGAIGIGGGLAGFDPFDLGGGFGDRSTGGFVPTLDLHPSPVHIQIHVMELVSDLIDNEEIFLGANVYFDAVAQPLTGSWLGVVQPGFGIDIYGDPLTIAITGECRLGPQVEEGAGFGVYVVPAVGIALDDGDAEWIAGGAIQLSAWFGT